jgi:hypothetical protein
VAGAFWNAIWRLAYNAFFAATYWNAGALIFADALIKVIKVAAFVLSTNAINKALPPESR